jgi:hypothetical protein
MNIKMGQSLRKLGILTTVLVFLIHSVAIAQEEGGGARPTPVMIDEITKDMQRRMLTFRINKDGQESIADFEYNPKEVMPTTVLQHMLREQEKHVTEWFEFVKSYLTSPQIFKQFGFGQTEQDRQLLIKQLSSAQQIDDLFQKLSTRKRQQVGMAYKAKTYDPQALKKFYARYLGLPENSGQKMINDRLVAIKKHSPQIIDEMIRVFHVNHDGLGYRLYSAVSRPINTQLHGFPTQSALFAIAIGAVMMSKMVTDYAANPAALQQHLDSLDDPLAHIAFYSFMAANGLVGDFLTAKWGGPGMAGVSAQKFRQAAIPYIGMTAGMLASNLTHEVGNLISVCSDKLMGKKPNPVEMAMMQMMGGDKGKDPCDLAQEEFFNFENKVEQYFPMIISMALSTAGSTVAQQVITKSAIGGVQALKNFTEYDNYLKERVGAAQKPLVTTHGRESSTRYFSKVAGGDLLKASKKIPNATIRVTGLILTARFIPFTGFWFNTLTVGTTMYSIAQNYAFIYLDTVMIPWLSKQWAQIWRAGGVDSAEKKLKLSIEYYEKKGWVIDSRDRGCENAMQNARSPDCPSNMLKNLEDFQKQMEAWRMQNHARFFTGIQVWNEVTTNLINEVDQAQKFYTFYINDVFKNERIRKREKFLGHEVKDVDKNHKQNLTGRPAPLYGIRPLGHIACQPNLAAMMMGQQQPKDESCDTELSLYLNHPDKMIGYQRNRVQSVVNIFGELFNMEKKALPYVFVEEKSEIDVFNSNPTEIAEKEKAIQQAAQPSRQNTLTNERAIDKWNEALKAYNLQIKAALATGNKPLAQSLIAMLFREDGSFNTYTVNQHLKAESKAFIKQILIDFETSDVEKIAKALIKINSELRYPKLRDPVLDVVLEAIRHALGSPTPILVNGGAVPYIYHESNKGNQGYKSVSRTAGRYKFNRHVEYLLYQMLCGPDSGSNKMVTEFGFSEKYPLLPPKFHAPKVTTAKNIEVEWNIDYQPKKGPFRTELCDPYAQDPIPFDGLYYSKIYVDGSKTPVSFFELINTTIPSYIIGDLTERSGTRDERITTENIVSRSNESRVGTWWDASVKNAIKQIFEKLDNRYQGLLVDLYLGLQQDEYDVEMPGTDLNGMPDFYNTTTVRVKPTKRTEASQSLLQSNIEEMNVYLKILSGLEKNQMAVNNNGGKALPVAPGRVILDRSGKSMLSEMRHDPKADTVSQEKLMGHIQTVIKLLREVKIKTVNGQQRVSVGDQSIPLKKFQSESMAAFKEYAEEFEKLGIKDPTQLKIQKLAFQGLEKTLQNLTVYLLNIQLANYSMIKNFENYVKDNKNDGQNKAPVKSSSSLPGR